MDDCTSLSGGFKRRGACADLKFVITLAGYIQWKLTGDKIVGVGEASGMFPIDIATGQFNEKMIAQFDEAVADKGFAWKLKDVLPAVYTAGQQAGALTEEGAKLFVVEKLMTHDKQSAVSNMDIHLNGAGSSAQIISRSVARGDSRQVFHPKAIGNALCRAHIQCDSIIMDQAQVCSIPEIDAKHVDAAIIHEAAIGRINNEQMIKLNTFGLSDEAAEAVIIENFLN